MTLETQFQQPTILNPTALCVHESAAQHHDCPAKQQHEDDSSLHGGAPHISDGAPHGQAESDPDHPQPHNSTTLHHDVTPPYGAAQHVDSHDPNLIVPNSLNLLRWMTFAHGEEEMFRPSLLAFCFEVVRQFDSMLLHDSEQHHIAKRAITRSWPTLTDAITDGEAKVRALLSTLLEEWQSLRGEHALEMHSPLFRYGTYSNALAHNSTSATSALVT